jgi:uncharacterized protein with HEPN domain
MVHDDMVYLGHMLDTAQKITAKVHGLSKQNYDADENLRLALVHLIQVIGEAARHVSNEKQGALPDIPWREITGMRHKIVHDYMDIDEDLVWEVATVDIPPLVVVLERIFSLFNHIWYDKERYT